MTFKPGDPKPEKSGRKPGTPNKATNELKAILESYGIHAVKELAEILPTLTVEKRADLLMKLMEYLYPKRRAVEAAVELAAEVEASRPLTLNEATLQALIARGDDNMTFARMKELMRKSGTWPDSV